MLQIEDFAFLVLEGEADFQVLLGLWIDLAGSDREFVLLSIDNRCQAQKENGDEESKDCKHLLQMGIKELVEFLRRWVIFFAQVVVEAAVVGIPFAVES